MKLNGPSCCDQIAGVILAAGASMRMGQAKLLLPWRGKPIIQYAVNAALDSGLNPVLVITGKYHDEIVQALTNTRVTFVKNDAWLEGQSSSVRTGIEVLPQDTLAVVFLLGDQPMIPTSAISLLVKHYLGAQTRPLVLAPTVNGKRANPVLFDRAVFPDLKLLKGDEGARQIFTQFPPTLIEMDEPGLLLDIDSPDDYIKLNQR
jgi:molybdenum cofactor cytidylyltransferase